jgi:hypothetical protein
MDIYYIFNGNDVAIWRTKGKYSGICEAPMEAYVPQEENPNDKCLCVLHSYAHTDNYKMLGKDHHKISSLT